MRGIGKAGRSAAEPELKETPRETVLEEVGQAPGVAGGSVQVLHHVPNKQLDHLQSLKANACFYIWFLLVFVGFITRNYRGR